MQIEEQRFENHIGEKNAGRVIKESDWEKILAGLPKNKADKLRKTIEKEMSVPPKVAVIGKSGVGKTTTINSLFDVEWHTSESITGTTEAQRETFQLKGGGNLTVIDMPGLGDSIANDEKFMEIYQKILPEVDVIFYIIQADDRGLGEDERIIKEILECEKKLDEKFVLGINKVDLLGENEGLEWDSLSNLPSEEQEKLIKQKCNDICKHFLKISGIKQDSVAYFSATTRYNLYQVLYAIIMHSGNMGWKFSVCPKDWKELADPRIRKLAEEREEYDE